MFEWYDDVERRWIRGITMWSYSPEQIKWVEMGFYLWDGIDWLRRVQDV